MSEYKCFMCFILKWDKQLWWNVNILLTSWPVTPDNLFIPAPLFDRQSWASGGGVSWSNRPPAEIWTRFGCVWAICTNQLSTCAACYFSILKQKSQSLTTTQSYQLVEVKADVRTVKGFNFRDNILYVVLPGTWTDLLYTHYTLTHMISFFMYVWRSIVVCVRK